MPVDDDNTLSVNAERAVAACYSGQDMTVQVKAELCFWYDTTAVVIIVYLAEAVVSLLLNRIHVPATVLRQGPHRQLALHGQAW